MWHATADLWPVAPITHELLPATQFLACRLSIGWSSSTRRSIAEIGAAGADFFTGLNLVKSPGTAGVGQKTPPISPHENPMKSTIRFRCFAWAENN
jgi:hypothetical protein